MEERIGSRRSEEAREEKVASGERAEAAAADGDADGGDKGGADIVSEFFVTTTAHGFLHIVQNSLTIRVVWALLIVAAFAGFGFHLSTLVQKFLSYPLTTEIRFSEVDFEFPDVTMCLTTKYRHCINRDYVDSNEGLVTTSSVPSLNHSFWSALNNTYTFWRQVYGMRDDLQVKFSTLGMRGYTYEINITNRRTDIATGIEYKQAALNLDDVVSYDDPEQFRCATVRPKQRTIQSVSDAMGLIFSIFDQYRGNVSTPLVDRAWVAGVRLALSEPNTRPNLLNSFIVSPGTIKHAKVSMTRQEKRKTPKQDCFESTSDLPIRVLNPDGSLSSYRYAQSDCRELQLQRHIIEKCGCISNFKLVPAEFKDRGLKYCLDLDPTILKAQRIFTENGTNGTSGTIYVKRKDSVVVTMDSILEQTGFQAQHSCHLNALTGFETSADVCPPSCVAYTYQVYTSESLWPFQIDAYFAQRIMSLFQAAYNYSLQKGLPVPLFKCYEAGTVITPEDYWLMISYFNRVVISPNSLRGTQYQEKDGYTLASLFSNMGGILGLYVGVSVISVCEVLELLTLLCFNRFKRRQKP